MEWIRERIFEIVLGVLLVLGLTAYGYVLIQTDSKGQMLLQSLLWGLIGAVVVSALIPGSGFVANSRGLLIGLILGVLGGGIISGLN